MERIELFDRYINNQLSDDERRKFDKRLKDDDDFAGDFNVYLLTIDGICKEAHQDDIDFGIAMKALSKDQLCDVIGKTKTEYPAAASMPETPRNLHANRFRLKPWILQVASIAAVIIVAFTLIITFQKRTQNAVYDNIYASAHFEEPHIRGAVKPIDITKLDDSELKAKLPEMEEMYENCEDPEELYEYGYPLAMAYIRLHQPKPALKILDEMVSKLQHDDYYEPEVREMRLMINMLQ